jgi:hypothetical protein
MNEQKKCEFCGNPLPIVRRKNARYCNDECYYEAKKIRSNKTYHSLIKLKVKTSQNESILGFFYDLTQAQEIVTVEMLAAKRFDFGFSEEESQDESRNIWRLIGSYYYCINRDKTVQICRKST